MIAIDDATWAALTAAAEAAYPREACGWLDDRGVRPAATGDRTGFAFGDDDLLALAAAARGPRPPRALYHSHPDGDDQPSPADLAALAPGGVPLHPLPHLVIAVAGGRAHAASLWQLAAPARKLAGFRRDDHSWVAVPVADLDLTGEICPYTFVRTRLALEALPLGAELAVTLDHAPGARNVPRSARDWGQEVLAVEELGPGRWRVRLRKRVT